MMDNISVVKAAFDAYTDWSGVWMSLGQYSVTDLITPPRIVHLRNRHKDKLPEEFVEDRIKAFGGNAWHSFFERNLRKANNSDKWKNRFLVESKMMDIVYDKRISCKIDAFDVETNTLYDFKVTGTYKYMHGDWDDWELQLNLYARMLRVFGRTVDHAAIIGVFPDWKAFEQKKDKKYPEFPIVEIPMDIWSTDRQEEEIYNRVKLLVECEEISDDRLPECTPEDCWVKPSTFALMEKGKSRATRVLPTYEEMEKYINWREENNKALKAYDIVERKGGRIRCEKYCQVSMLCNQYLEYQMEEELNANG